MRLSCSPLLLLCAGPRLSGAQPTATSTWTVTLPSETQTQTVTATLPSASATETGTVTVPTFTGTATATVTLPTTTVSTTGTASLPTVSPSRTVTATLPSRTATMTVSITLPTSTETIAETFTLPTATATSTATQTLPSATVTPEVTVTMPTRTATATATVTLATLTVSATLTATLPTATDTTGVTLTLPTATTTFSQSQTLPSLTGSPTYSKTLTGTMRMPTTTPTLTESLTLPSLTGTQTAEITLPTATGSATATVSLPSQSATEEETLTLPSATVSRSATFTLPERTETRFTQTLPTATATFSVPSSSLTQSATLYSRGPSCTRAGLQAFDFARTGIARTALTDEAFDQCRYVWETGRCTVTCNSTGFTDAAEGPPLIYCAQSGSLVEWTAERVCAGPATCGQYECPRGYTYGDQPSGTLCPTVDAVNTSFPNPVCSPMDAANDAACCPNAVPCPSFSSGLGVCSCDTGYNVTPWWGPVWTGTTWTHTCSEIRCPTLSLGVGMEGAGADPCVDGMRLGVAVDTVCALRCKDGYQTASGTVSCSNTGSLVYDPASLSGLDCSERKCSALPLPSGSVGGLSGGEYQAGGCVDSQVLGQVVNTSCTLQCQRGYSGGAVTVTCPVGRPDGAVTVPSTLVCTEARCAAYAFPEGAVGAGADPCVDGVQLTAINDTSCGLACETGYVGAATTLQCPLDGVDGRPPLGGIACVKSCARHTCSRGYVSKAGEILCPNSLCTDGLCCDAAACPPHSSVLGTCECDVGYSTRGGGGPVWDSPSWKHVCALTCAHPSMTHCSSEGFALRQFADENFCAGPSGDGTLTGVIANDCTVQMCCVATCANTQSTDCAASGLVPKPAPDGVQCTTSSTASCTAAICCDAVCDHPQVSACAAFGLTAKPGTGIVCEGAAANPAACTAQTCCDVTHCAAFTCPEGFSPLTQAADCGGICALAQCCTENTCLTPVNGLYNGGPAGGYAFGGASCAAALTPASACTIECAAGHYAAAEPTLLCAAPGGTFSVQGCAANRCRQTSRLAAYVLSGGADCTTVATCGGVSCVSGTSASGTPSISCPTDGAEFVATGCRELQCRFDPPSAYVGYTFGLAATVPDTWDYWKPDRDWPPVCKGLAQSPIDINATTATALGTETLARVSEYTSAAAGAVLSNTGQELVVTGSFGNLTLEGERRQGTRLLLRFPAEHTVRGVRHAGELQIAHGDTAVAFLLSASSSNPASVLLDSLGFTTALPEAGSKTTLTGTVDLATPLAAALAASFWTYKGSWTAPPCAESVRWFIAEQTLPISTAQVARFNDRFQSPSSRLVQPLNGRQVLKDTVADPSFFWDYTDVVASWQRLSTLCGGQRQSPINIPVASVGGDGGLRLANVASYVPSAGVTVQNTGQTLKVSGSFGYVTVGGIRYNANEVHVRFASEHQVSGLARDGEVQIMHQRADGGSGRVAVAIMLLRGTTNDVNPFLASIGFLQRLPATGQVMDVAGSVSLASSFASQIQAGFWSYEGSLTFPPCTEDTKWIVLQSTAPVSREQIAHFQQLFPRPANSRPVQPLNARPILSGSFEGTSGSSPTGWSYNAAAAWASTAPTCGGNAQSPIRIDPTSAVGSAGQSLGRRTAYTAQFGLQLVNTGSMLEVKGSFGYITIGGQRYDASSLQFHFPAEHIVGAVQYAGEMHIVHRSATGAVVVVAVLFDLGARSPLLDSIGFLRPLPLVGRVVGVPSVDLVSSMASQLGDGFWSYDGSLTAPPCTEGVRWIVLQRTLTASTDQVARFNTIFPAPANNRPTQPLHGRPIYTSSFQLFGEGASLFSYSEWPAECSGAQQSPIRIDSRAAGPAGFATVADAAQYGTARGLLMSNTGLAIALNGTLGASMTVSGVKYDLRSIEMHAPAEHKVDDREFDAELQFVHTTGGTPGRTLVLALLMDVTADNTPSSLLDALGWDNQLPERGQQRAVAGTVDLMSHLAQQFARGFWRYEGSLTVPPCTEGVQWVVLQAPAAISAQQVDAFKRLFPNPANNRPIQPTSGRSVAVNTFDLPVSAGGCNTVGSCGAVGCADGFSPSGRPTLSCPVDGGSFSVAGCAANVCSATPVPPGYIVQNTGCTFVAACGTVVCAASHAGVASVSCPSAGEQLRYSGCRPRGVNCPANSAGDPCRCAAGYTGTVEWVAGAWTGSCTAAACPAFSTGAGTCGCIEGYIGAASWNGLRWTHQCEAAPCPTNAAGSGCPCSSGFSGTPTWSGAAWVHECTVSGCPPNAAGAGCSCVAGYTGTPAWSGSRWTHTCTAAPCPAGASPTGVCRCPQVSDAAAVWGGSGWTHSCASASAACPASSAPPGVCTCARGFSGTPNWNGVRWLHTCAVAPCPANSAGVGVCACITGFTGAPQWDAAQGRWLHTCGVALPQCVCEDACDRSNQYRCATTAGSGVIGLERMCVESADRCADFGGVRCVGFNVAPPDPPSCTSVAPTSGVVVAVTPPAAATQPDRLIEALSAAAGLPTTARLVVTSAPGSGDGATMVGVVCTGTAGCPSPEEIRRRLHADAGLGAASAAARKGIRIASVSAPTTASHTVGFPLPTALSVGVGSVIDFAAVGGVEQVAGPGCTAAAPSIGSCPGGSLRGGWAEVPTGGTYTLRAVADRSRQMTVAAVAGSAVQHSVGFTPATVLASAGDSVSWQQPVDQTSGPGCTAAAPVSGGPCPGGLSGAARVAPAVAGVYTFRGAGSTNAVPTTLHVAGTRGGALRPAGAGAERAVSLTPAGAFSPAGLQAEVGDATMWPAPGVDQVSGPGCLSPAPAAGACPGGFASATRRLLSVPGTYVVRSAVSPATLMNVTVTLPAAYQVAASSAPCPANSAGAGLCVCSGGFSGDPWWVPETSAWGHTCSPNVCEAPAVPAAFTVYSTCSGLRTGALCAPICATGFTRSGAPFQLACGADGSYADTSGGSCTPATPSSVASRRRFVRVYNMTAATFRAQSTAWARRLLAALRTASNAAGRSAVSRVLVRYFCAVPSSTWQLGVTEQDRAQGRCSAIGAVSARRRSRALQSCTAGTCVSLVEIDFETAQTDPTLDSTIGTALDTPTKQALYITSVASPTTQPPTASPAPTPLPPVTDAPSFDELAAHWLALIIVLPVLFCCALVLLVTWVRRRGRQKRLRAAGLPSDFRPREPDQRPREAPEFHSLTATEPVSGQQSAGSAGSHPCRYLPGCPVEALWEGNWIPATVCAAHFDGTADVDWGDGTMTVGLTDVELRPRPPDPTDLTEEVVIHSDDGIEGTDDGAWTAWRASADSFSAEATR